MHGGASEHPHTKRRQEREVKRTEGTERAESIRFAKVRKDRQDQAARIGGESRGNTGVTGLLDDGGSEGKSRELLLDEERARRARREVGLGQGLGVGLGWSVGLGLGWSVGLGLGLIRVIDVFGHDLTP